jgi:hypothetical protein
VRPTLQAATSAEASASVACHADYAISTILCSRLDLMQHVVPKSAAVDLIALADRLIAAYVAWRTECSAVTRAYGRLSTCGRCQRDAAFDVYAGALEREERAATTYRSVLEQITRLETELRGDPSRPDLTALPGTPGAFGWSAQSIAQRLGL